MSPTVFRHKSYRFFFFSREERRTHVHVSAPEGEAKFWLDPVVALAHHAGFNAKQLNQLHKLIEKRRDEITQAWRRHFRG
jgi:hypothetical protein